MLLACGVVAKKERGGFRKRPLQVDVADLRTAAAELLSCRAVITLHQPRVREEVLNSLEAFDVVDLVEDRQRQDLANPGTERSRW